jgi:hypothetical protein
MKDDENNTELTMQDMYQWKSHESIYNVTEMDGQITCINDQVFTDFIDGLISIETFVDRILESDIPAYKMTKNQIEYHGVQSVKEELKKFYLARYFTSVIKLFEYFSPDYKYSPNVELFFNCCFEFGLGREWFTDPLAYTTKRGTKPKRQYELFNELIKFIRIESRNAEFEGKIYNRQYNANRNCKSVVAFLRKLFVRRLLVLRVDLAYLPKHANSISVEEARKDLAHFLYNIRHNKELSENLEGYVWKIEFTELKKLHLHMLVMLDSSAVQSEEYWGNKYGSYWSEVITKGRGRFYNGNTKKEKKRFEINGLCGIGKIGRIHADPDDDLDLEKRNILLNTIVPYLMKADQVLLATKLENCKHRLFGKGVGRNRNMKRKQRG